MGGEGKLEVENPAEALRNQDGTCGPRRHQSRQPSHGQLVKS
jgi:hypothetical protein